MLAVSRFLSFVFHPIFVPLVSTLLLMMANPYLFGASRDLQLMFVIIYTIFYPLVGVLLLRGVGFVDSLDIPEKKQRTGPYLISAVFYLWFFANIRNNPDFPVAFSIILLGSIIAIFLCFFINIFDKVSAHAAGSAGLLVNCLLICYLFSDGSLMVSTKSEFLIRISMIYVVVFALFLAGLVAAARMKLEAHSFSQIIGGWCIGIIAPLAALKFISYVT